MVARQSIKDRVYESILEDIMQGVYPVNAILNERMLVEKFQVSKTPVREALVQLCSENILKSIPRSGYQLTPITPQEIVDAQELRLILELAALDKSIEHITPGQIALLEANVQESQELTEEMDVIKHWGQNMTFHLLLCSFCGNQLIYRSLDDTLKFCCRCAPQYFRHTWAQSKLSDSSNHVKMIELIRDKDLEKAKRLLAEDVSSMRQEILNF